MSAHAHGHDHHHEGGYEMPSFDNRELIVRDDILNQAKELARLVTTTEEVALFQQAEKRIQGHERVQGLIATIKKKQKELVAFQNTFKNAAMVEKIEAEIDALQGELDEIPIVRQFQQSQVDVNYMLQSILSVIRDTIAEKVDVEAAKPAEAPEECD
ncbi:RicAFT regulatory complex protein RicA family protein [Paenibacillaceae bacterium WGS1546]|uniref:RicAFT regulatory complex protein RicA family protein n=1 Tax=Cohnella sp. WGS1546 TaxID=3366810 RepID=UPI00372CF75A